MKDEGKSVDHQRCDRSDTPCDRATLSACMEHALRQRGDDEVMFVLLHYHADDSVEVQPSIGDAGAPKFKGTITREHVTKRVWGVFVSLLKQRFVVCGDTNCFAGTSDHDNALLGKGGSESICDVGLYSSETFYTCLVESVCMLVGWSFCVFRDDDPPLRLQRLEQRRRPRMRLYSHDIAMLLQEAQTAVVQGASWAEEHPLVAQIPDEKIAYYMYTSGSTGEPKCVVASRANVRAYLCHFVLHKDGLGVAADEECRFFCLSSPFFDPSIGDMLISLCTPHGVFYTATQEDLLNGRVAEVLAMVQPTHVVSTPAVWMSLTSAGLSRLVSPLSTPRMKVFLGGERVSQELVCRWADTVDLYNIYGVTEATIYQSVARIHATMRAECITCGPGVGTKICIRSWSGASGFRSGDDWERDVHGAYGEEHCTGEHGGFGEVVLCGDQVCCGYADEEATTVSAFGCDPISGVRFFRTGDIGRLVQGSCEGSSGASPQLQLRGRLDWQIKVNGQRVSLEEVESTVQNALEGLYTQCTCFCATGPPGKPLIGAAVVLKDAPSEEVLQRHKEGVVEGLQELLALHLPAFMIPRRWCLHGGGAVLPQTATGKVSRTQLALDAAQTSLEMAAEPTPVELHNSQLEEDSLDSAVRAAWQNALGVSVHRDTHYLHAGGDSLGALKLTRAIYISLQGGSDAGIDEHGGLPYPFQPCTLLQHPRFRDYVGALREGWTASLTPAPASLKNELGGDSEVRGQVVSPSLHTSIPPEEMRSDYAFREVVAAHCVDLAERLLFHALVDVNGHYTRHRRCATPLHVAVASCDSPSYEEATLRMVEVLLRHGAQVASVTPDGVTPLHLASSVSAPVLQRLLHHAPTLAHCRDGRQQSLLHFAARSGNVDSVRLLLHSYQFRLDTRDKWQRTAAHWAVLNGHVAVLEELASHYVAYRTASLPTEDNVGGKRPRSLETTTARYVRLARKKTFLSYETLREIADRVSPGDERVAHLCDLLAVVVGESISQQ